MKLDVNVLGTFYRMAREGAGLAAGRLTQMTGVETRVGVTKLNFMRGNEIRSEFEDGVEKVGIRVELSNGFDGHSVIVFEREAALRIVETLVAESSGGDFDEMNRSAVTEVGQIMNNGFIDGWADVLATVIDISTPEFIEGSSVEPFFGDLEEAPQGLREEIDSEDVDAVDDLALLFQSQIEAVDTEIGFEHYLFPDHDTIADILDRRRDDDHEGIEFDKLVGFDKLAQQGAREVANTATTLTGVDTDVEVRRLNFLSLEAIPEEISDQMYVGVAFEFDGTPSGYLLFLFDEDSATEIVEAMLPTPPDETFGEMGTSAITELGNIMASGLLDGWANVLDTTIDHSTPEFIRDMGSAVIDPVVVQLGENQEFAFVFDTEIRAEDHAFNCDIYAIPDEDDLEKALNNLDVTRIDETPTTAEFREVQTDS